MLRFISIILIITFLGSQMAWAGPVTFHSLRPRAFQEKKSTSSIDQEISKIVERFVQKHLGLQGIEVPQSVIDSIMTKPSNPAHVEVILGQFIKEIVPVQSRKEKGITEKDKARATQRLRSQSRNLVQQIQAAHRRTEQKAAKVRLAEQKTKTIEETDRKRGERVEREYAQKAAEEAAAERRRRIVSWMREGVLPHLRSIAEGNFRDFSALREASVNQDFPDELRRTWQEFVQTLEGHYKNYQRSNVTADIPKFVHLFNKYWLAQSGLLMMFAGGVVEDKESFEWLDNLVFFHVTVRFVVKHNQDSVDIILVDNESKQETDRWNTSPKAEAVTRWSPAWNAIIIHPQDPLGIDPLVNAVWALGELKNIEEYEYTPAEIKERLKMFGFDPDITVGILMPLCAEHRKRYKNPEIYRKCVIEDVMGEELRHWTDYREVERAAKKSFPINDYDFCLTFGQTRLREGGLLRQIFDNPLLPSDNGAILEKVKWIRQIKLSQAFYELSGRMTRAGTAVDPTILIVGGLKVIERPYYYRDEHGWISKTEFAFMIKLLAKYWNYLDGELTIERVCQLPEDDIEFKRIANRVIQRVRQSPEDTRLALKAIYAQQYQNADGSPAQIDEYPFAEIDSQGRRHARIPSIALEIKMLPSVPRGIITEIPKSEHIAAQLSQV